jgi:hypothetical protein
MQRTHARIAEIARTLDPEQLVRRPTPDTVHAQRHLGQIERVVAGL